MNQTWSMMKTQSSKSEPELCWKKGMCHYQKIQVCGLRSVG